MVLAGCLVMLEPREHPVAICSRLGMRIREWPGINRQLVQSDYQITRHVLGFGNERVIF